LGPDTNQSTLCSDFEVAQIKVIIILPQSHYSADDAFCFVSARFRREYPRKGGFSWESKIQVDLVKVKVLSVELQAIICKDRENRYAFFKKA